MYISKLIKELQGIQKEHGDIQTTCTGSMLQDDYNERLRRCVKGDSDVFETTADTLLIREDKQEVFGKKHVRICL
jgi:hypothetical protein